MGRVRRTAVAAMVALLVAAGGGVALWRSAGPGGTGGASPRSAETAAAAPAAREARRLQSPAPEPAAESDGLPPPVDLDACDRDLDLHGVVVTKDGAPVAGADVSAWSRPWRRTTLLNVEGYREAVARVATRTARDGTFALRLARGEQVGLRVAASGFATVELPQRAAGERVRVVLSPGVRLTIAAAVASGAPAAGARFRVFGRWRSDVEVDRTCTTDAAGLGAIDALPGGAKLWIDLVEGDFGDTGWAECDLPEAGEHRQAIELTAGRTIRGRVTDAATGAAVPGARVGMNWVLDRAVTAQDDGAYELPGWTGKGVHDVHVLAEGFARGQETVGARETIDFALRRGFAVAGRVVDVDGLAVAGAQVGAIASVVSGSEQHVSTGHSTTDAEGRFRITSLDREMPHFLVVAAAGWARHRAAIPAPPAGEDVDLGVVALAVPRAIEGRVLDASGAAVAGAEVVADGPRAHSEPRYDANWYGLSEERRTDDLGRFRFPDLAPGRYVVRTRPAGAPEAETECTLPADRDALDVVLRLAPTRTIVVHVRDDAGRPIVGAVVQDSGPGGVSGKTDEHGDARLTAPTGDLELFAWPSSEGTRRFVPMPPIRVTGGDAEATIVVHEGSPLRGRVLDPEGNPVTRATIAIQLEGEPRNFLTTNAEGEFEIVLPSGAVVAVEFSGIVAGKEAPYAGRIAGITPGGAEVVLRLERIATDRVLRVRVMAPDGEPMPGAKLWVQPTGAGTPRMVTADEQGCAEVRDLPVRAVRVSLAPGALPGGGMACPPRPVEVVPDGSVVVLAMRRAAPVRGELVDADGRPARGVVTAWRGDEYLVSVGTDADGRFALPLPADEPGPWRLTARPADAAPGADVVEVKDVAAGASGVRIALPAK